MALWLALAVTLLILFLLDPKFFGRRAADCVRAFRDRMKGAN
ncbi:hypothetical protein [Mesorhizobium sp.]|nr:hypothetical protein [Mesorhizobium sp.]